MYHLLEVAEAEPTEAGDVEEVEVGDAGNLVAIKIKIVQRMEQHRHRPEEPRRRSKQRPPVRKITLNRGHTSSMVCHHQHPQRPRPRQRTRPFHPQLLRHINQRQHINQRRHTYHPLEVAEAKPTEAEDVEEAEVGDADNLVATKIEIVRRMEHHHQRPEEPSRRAK